MKQLVSGIILVIVSLLASPVGAHEERTTVPGVFDYYLLNMSWAPEFCHSPRNVHSRECQTDGLGFVLHGLWPQFTKGYPENCSNAPGPANPAALSDIMPTPSLVQHEWRSHGTCSGLNATEYFSAARKAFASIRAPEQLKSPSRPFSITPANVKQEFVDANPGLRTENIAISCGNNYLTAVEICLDKETLKPVRCGQVRECRATVIRVVPVRN